VSRGTIVLLVLIAFASGAASGGLFVARTAPPIPVGARGRQTLDEIMREVQPTDPQREQIARLIDEYHPRYAAVRARIEPEVAVIRSELRSKIRASLDAEQAARFDDYCRRRDEQRLDH
jgi:hypothetical protein